MMHAFTTIEICFELILANHFFFMFILGGLSLVSLFSVFLLCNEFASIVRGFTHKQKMMMSSLQKRYALPIISRPTYTVKARNITKMEISGHVYMYIYIDLN